MPLRFLARPAFAFALIASAVTSAIPPSSLAHAQTMPAANIVDTAVAAGSFTTLATALEAAGLVDTLTGPGPFTVFAPTDAAFANLPAGTLDSLLADPDALREVLTYHVVVGRVTAADAMRLHSATTVQGEELAISTDGGKVRANDAVVTSADLMASNGVIHVVDSVLLPPSMASQQMTPTPAADVVDTALAAGQFNTLATALEAAGLVDSLKGPGPFTVFAPTDDAFAQLPAGTLDALLADPDTLRAVLSYHVVAGRVTAAEVAGQHAATTLQGEDVTFAAGDYGVLVDDASVTQPDVMASNGVIHVIDRVILPPSIALQLGAGH